MAVAPRLLEILVCPESKQPLVYFADEGFLLCAASKLRYPVRDDIPVMLVDEAERLDDETVEGLIREARQRGLANA